MISEVPIGNLMKGAEMLPFMLSPPCRRVGVHRRAPFLVVENLDGPAGQHAIVARGDDALAGRRGPARPAPGRPRSGSTFTSRSSALDVGRDDIGEKTVGPALHGRVGNHHHILHGLDEQARGHRQARPQRVVRDCRSSALSRMVPLAGSTWLSSELERALAELLLPVGAVGRHLQRTGLQRIVDARAAAARAR